MRKLPFFVAGLACATTPALAFQASWTTLGTGNAYDMSDDGTAVTGNDFSGGGSFVWTQSGGQQNIGQNGGTGVSDDGTIVFGNMTDMNGDSVAGRWTMATGWVSLGGIGGQSGTSISTAYGASADGGVCAGLAWENAGTAGAFRWTMPTGMTQIPDMGSSSARANGVSNDGGFIAGWDRLSASSNIAAIWDSSSVETLILVGQSWNPTGFGDAWGFSANNQYVAGASMGEGFVYDTVSGMAWQVGTLPSSDMFQTGETYSVSNDGTKAVGFYRVAFPFDNRATIWTPGGGLEELKTYLQDRGATGVPNLTIARVISGDGQRVLATDGSVWGIADLGAPCGSSSNFCSTAPNSVDATGAIISSNGQFSVMANALELSASPVPVQPGIFYYSSMQESGGNGVPFGNGFRCLAMPFQRLDVVFPTTNELNYQLDMTAPPTPGGQITPGSTWYFQAWYRDPDAGGATYNLSDGLEITFCP